jgi:L-ascorbate metabolism protein UlaG (beta-lactamase superfamily)
MRLPLTFMAAGLYILDPVAVDTSHLGGAPTDGKRFYNLAPFEEHRFGTLLKWMFNRDLGVWQDRTLVAPGPVPPPRLGPGELRITVIGHATVLMQMDGLNILTDPVFSDRIGPWSWIGPRRMRAPGLRFEDLPPIDVVVISHNHWDHMDLPSLKRLNDVHHPRFFVGLKNSGLLRDAGIENVEEIDWWQSRNLSPSVELIGVPAQHWSKRGLADDFTMLWLGYVIRGPYGYVYFAGDTAWGPHFEQIADRFGPPRLALLPIGAFRPRWLMQRAHLSPSEAVDAARVLRAQTVIPVHYGTFRLGDDGQDEPVEVLDQYLKVNAEPKPNFVVPDFGEGYVAPPPQPSGR